MNQRQEHAAYENANSPQLVDAAIEATSRIARLERRGLQAAARGLGLQRMKKRRKTLEFEPESLANYLRRLSEAAHVSLAPILQRLCGSELPTTGEWTRLAQSVGMTFAEVKVYLRVEIAGKFGVVGWDSANRLRAGRGGADWEHYAAALSKLEEMLDDDGKEELRRMEEIARANYGV